VTVRIHRDDRWRPHGVEPLEIGGVLFDVRFERYEMLMDELRHSGIGVRLGFQPSAAASGRGGAEVDEKGLVLAFSLRERSVGVSDPLYSHDESPCG